MYRKADRIYNVTLTTQQDFLKMSAKLIKVQNDNDLMRDAITRIAVGPNRGKDIDRPDAAQIMRGVLEGRVDPVQTAVFLIALRMKREAIEEFLGIFDAMQSKVVDAEVNVPRLYSIADPFDGYVRCYSMTAFMPAVLAACGMPCVMKGVESVGPKHGVTAHQIYSRSGIVVDSPMAKVASDIETVGWGYADQAQYAPELNQLNHLRDQIVKRTALTTLERLLMPLRATQKNSLVLGYVHKDYPEIYSAVAEAAAYSDILLLKGVEGGLAPALSKPVRRYSFDFTNKEGAMANKEIFDLPDSLCERVPAYGVEASILDPVAKTLDLGLRALSGEAGVARNSLVVSAAQIINVYGEGVSFPSAVDKVQNCLDNGAAKQCFQSLIVSA